MRSWRKSKACGFRDARKRAPEVAQFGILLHLKRQGNGDATILTCVLPIITEVLAKVGGAGSEGAREPGKDGERMRREERVLLREKLDHEQRLFRAAARKAGELPQWLRRVRQGLGLQAAEMARDLDVNVSVIFRLEKSEEHRSISLRALERMAETMGCRLVYAIVPRGGKTLAELAEERSWKKKLRKAGTGVSF